MSVQVQQKGGQTSAGSATHLLCDLMVIVPGLSFPTGKELSGIDFQIHPAVLNTMIISVLKGGHPFRNPCSCSQGGMKPDRTRMLALGRARTVPWASMLMTQPTAGPPERQISQQKPEMGAPHLVWGNLSLRALLHPTHAPQESFY